MTDGVPKQTGNSRYLKSAIPEDITHEQLVEMLRNGTLPIDLNGINPDGWAELGTPLNKASLLNDETTSYLGIPTTSTPTEGIKKAAEISRAVESKLNSLSVTGSFSINPINNDPVTTKKTITLGFRPKMVLCYSERNSNEIPVALGRLGPTDGIRIITGAVSFDEYQNVGYITSSGFVAEFTANDVGSLTTVYYIAFK